MYFDHLIFGNDRYDLFSRAIAEWISQHYDETKSYAVGDYCYYEDKLYRCQTAATGAWDSTKWAISDIASLVADLSEKSLTIQTVITPGTDFDTITTNGIRHFAKNANYAHAPFDDNGYLLVANNGQEPNGVADIMQLAYRMAGSGATSFEMYLRTGKNGVWRDWAKSISETDKTLMKPDYPADAEVVGAYFDDHDTALLNLQNRIGAAENKLNALADEDFPDFQQTVTETLNSHDARITSAAGNAASALNDTGTLKVQMQGATSSLEDIDGRMETMETTLESYINNAVVYEDENRVAFCHDDEELFSVPWGGGGGGGGSATSVIMSSRMTTGWITKNSRIGVDVPISFEWSSLEDNMETGPGYVLVECKYNSMNISIQQGEVSITIPGEWIEVDTNTIKLTIYDSLGNVRRHTLKVIGKQLSISSSLDVSNPFYGNVTITYTPSGDMNKTVYFYLDGTLVGTVDAGKASETAMTYTIPQQPAGVHSLEFYAIGTLNNEEIPSNHLYYEMMWLDEYSSRPLITVSHKGGEIGQYVPLNMAWRVYNPSGPTTDVTVSINGTAIQTLQNVDRAEQTFSYVFEQADDPDDPEDVTVVSFFAEGMTEPKSVTFKVVPADVQIEAETTGLELYLDSKNRSNSEANWNTWQYEGISAQFSGFNKFFDGWQVDEEGQVMLRLLDDARLYIPYTPFNRQFTSNGYTISIAFKSHNVIDYDAPIISCMNGGKGFSITPTMISYNTGTSLWQRYSDNDFIRLDIVFDASNYHSLGDDLDSDRMIRIFINGVWCRAIRYADSERTTQANPVGISIGSSDAGVDIYTIRCYNRSLTNRQIEKNWIADTRDPVLRVQRYNENNIFDSTGRNVTTETLKEDVPYFIISVDALPTSKDDKKTADIEFVDNLHPSMSFRIVGATIASQGTSSQKYWRKNISIKAPKNSILLSGSSTPVSAYAMTSESVPFNSWVLKKDVASCEGKNNVVGVDAYNRFCPYKTPEMDRDPRTRWGIEGRAAALFWNNTTNNKVEFIGKVNFNLPKRAPGPYAYPEDDEQLANNDIPSRLESWEIETNNTENVKFQAADFEGEAWKADFEARIPDKYFVNDKIKFFAEFVASTNREKATGDALSAPEVYTVDSMAPISFYPVAERGFTYTGNNPYTVTCTHDTPARRLIRFRAMAPLYMQMNAFCFYYMYVYTLLGTDSYAKNLFIGFRGDSVTDSRIMDHFKRKAVPEPYDMDTILGINNSGFLTYSPFLTDTDRVESNISGSEAQDDGLSPVFQAQDSVLMNNIRDAFWEECRTALSDAIARGFNAEELIRMFRAHAKPWSPAVYNADEFNTYAYPLFYPVHVDEATGNEVRTEYYLPMIQGDKDSQMTWFIRNRFRFVCSQYTVGPAQSVYITCRINNVADLDLYYVKNIFGGMRFGEGGANQVKRVTSDDEPINFVYNEGTTVTNFEIRIFSGDLVRKIDGLAATRPNEVDFSMASRIEEIVLGGDTPNTFLNNFNATNCPNLQVLNLRNCPNLTSTIHLENSRNIKTVLLDGSSSGGVELMEGCKIETLSLPSTCTLLVLRYLPELTTLTVPSWTNVDTFMLAGVDTSVLSPLTALNNLPANTAINIEDLDMTVSAISEIDTFYTKLDTMNGVTRVWNGTRWTYTYDMEDKNHPGSRVLLPPQVSGTIHTASARGEDITRLQNWYPNITIDAAQTESTRTYASQDGATTIGTVICDNGKMRTGQTPPSSVTPSATTVANYNSAQYTYTFAGWSTHPLSETTDVTNDEQREAFKADHIFYAAFSKVVRTYTVTWKNADGSTLKTETQPYGATSRWSGSMPTNSSGQTATGWNPSPGTVTGNITYTATYVPMYTVNWYNGSELMKTEQVQQGSSATPPSGTPVSPDGDGYVFIGWDKSYTNIQANTNIYAQYKMPLIFVNPSFDVSGAYAVQWHYGDGENSALARGGAAKDFNDPVPATSKTTSGSSPFDNVAPWKDMISYNVADGEITYREGTSGFSYTNDVVTYIPEFYYKVEQDDTNKRHTWAISPTAKSGYKKHPGSGRYLGRYHTSGSSSGVFTVSGQSPLVNTNLGNFRTYSKNKGTHWRMQDLATWGAYQMLFLVEFADWDSQTVIGTGQDSGSRVAEGTLDGAVYHTVKASGSANMYRGIENPFSNVLSWTDGFIASSGKAYVSTDPSVYNNTVTGLTDSGVTLPASNWISKFACNEYTDWAFVPIEAAGSQTTFVRDYVYTNSSGVRGLCVGGLYNRYAYYGVCYFDAYYNVTNASGHLGSRLLLDLA